MNIRYILLGVFLLLVGSLVYLVDRPPEHTYFIFSLPFEFSLYAVYPPLFGPLGDFLPHYLHVSAFILMSAGVLNCGKRGFQVICLFWLVVCVSFELGQKYSEQAASLVPRWFDGIFLLENTRGYFLHGTYCNLDMAAIVAGVLSAYLFLVYTHNKAIRQG